MKPLNIKLYGSIGHLPGSRLGPGDHRLNDGQNRILTIKARDKHDRVFFEQKLDGSCVGMAKLDDGTMVPLGRAGHTAISSPYEQHRRFHDWAMGQYARFDGLLSPGERLVGEWLSQAHSIRYKLPHEPFVAFDLMRGAERTLRDEFRSRVAAHGFVTPQLVSDGPVITTEAAMRIASREAHGALDDPEGVVYRCERKGRVEIMAKFVRSDFVPGRYLPELTKSDPVWNERAAVTA